MKYWIFSIFNLKMKNPRFYILHLLLFKLAIITFAQSTPEPCLEKMSFWDVNPRRGCNCFNEIPSEQWFKDAGGFKITMISQI